jgi:glycosyltransferase involved in cell wall biosynthesis
MYSKKISIIGTVGIPAKYGGFETLTEYLTKNLGKDYDITVFCSSKAYSNQITTHNNCKLKYINLNANGVQSIPYDILSLLKSLKFADTILILGVSGCIALPFIKLFNKRIKIVTNIDGLEWKRDKWNKYAKGFLKFSEKLAVKYSDTVVADNKVIQDYVKNEYGISSELIAYGADHVQEIDLSKELLEKYTFLKNKYAFKVCRIEPENNIHMILEAMEIYKKMPFVIIGNWNASEYGKDLKNRYKDIENIFILDPIYDQKILNQIRSNCYIYLHGHSAGGTNPSLVEAMALELPIFAYGINYNKETTKHKAKYFNSASELVELLNDTNANKLNDISSDMLEIANQEYIWKSISNKYSKLF